MTVEHSTSQRCLPTPSALCHAVAKAALSMHFLQSLPIKAVAMRRRCTSGMRRVLASARCYSTLSADTRPCRRVTTSWARLRRVTPLPKAVPTLTVVAAAVTPAARGASTAKVLAPASGSAVTEAPAQAPSARAAHMCRSYPETSAGKACAAVLLRLANSAARRKPARPRRHGRFTHQLAQL